MNSTILNRDFKHPADGWYQIEAKGVHPNQASKVVQVIDEEAINTVVNRFNEEAAAGKLRQGHEMLIDHEHFSDMPDQESRAYGWLQQLQNREDGIYGRIRWTKTGQEAVDGGDYRFFSTEYDQNDLKVLNGGKTRRVRPLRLDGLSLTNMNNNRGQKPITNRGMSPAPADGNCPTCKTPLKPGAAGASYCATCQTNFAAADAAADKNGNQIKNKMKNLLTAMGLSADASEENALAEFAKIKNRLAALEPHEVENTTLKNRLTALETEQVAGLLDLHVVKDEKVRNRLTTVLAGMKNREERVAALIDFGFKAGEGKGKETNTTGRVLNREDGRAPVEGAQVAAGNDKDLAAKAEGEINDFKIKNRCTYAEARNSVRRAKPELFGLK